jgi:uncharacterized repeat protein (TIGR03803 family)
MRAFQTLLCCAILAGCVRNASPLPNALSDSDAPTWRATQHSTSRQPHTGSVYKTLYSFKGSPDGAAPMSNLVAMNGELYGTTQWGGEAINDGYGTIFKVSPSGAERVFHTFGFLGVGSESSEENLFTLDGKFYGTNDNGVFVVDAAGGGRKLYTFKAAPDGGGWSRGALIAVDGKLYGTTLGGGINGGNCGEQAWQGCGTVFEVSRSGAERVLYRFKGSPDGDSPNTGVTFFNGKLYGTTANGGTRDGGTIFEVSMAGKERVLHRFKGKPDGANPYYAKLIVLNGNLYGATQGGGENGLGTIFEITASGKERVLHSFDSEDGGGVTSLAALDGRIYGTSAQGGTSDAGTIFEMSTSGEEHVLYNFGSFTGVPAPANPRSLLALNHRLYGTTSAGGISCKNEGSGCGTVFEFSP